MRRTAALLAMCAVTAIALVPALGQVREPRLAVVLVVDQMRADYLSVLERHWRAGFRTLLSEGAVFERTAYPYFNTVTCAGHATISTGTFPHTHGMIGNEWWDREKKALVDCTISESPSDAHVSYGTPAKEGNSPALLRARTIGDEARAQRPGSRAVSLSLKADAAIAMGGHGGDVITWFDVEARSFVTSKAFATRPNPVLSAFLTREPLRNELATTWTLRERPDTYVFPDATLGEKPSAGRDGLFPHAIGGPKGADARSAGLWRQSPLSDRYLARMASALVEGLELGRDDTPDVLTVSLSALDVVGHAYGPQSREVEDVLVNLDATIGELIAALDRLVGRDHYVLALSADHGVPPIPQGAVGGRIVYDEIRERLEELLRSHWGESPAGDYVDFVYSASVYFGRGVFDRMRAEPAVFQDVVKSLQTVPGIASVLLPEERSVVSPDPLRRAAALSYMQGRSGDLVFVPEPNWILVERSSSLATNHGSPHDYDQQVPLILFGAGIKSGRYTQAASPADIAPTLASLIGIRMAQAEGRVLGEALATLQTADSVGPRGQRPY